MKEQPSNIFHINVTYEDLNVIKRFVFLNLILFLLIELSYNKTTPFRVAALK